MPKKVATKSLADLLHGCGKQRIIEELTRHIKAGNFVNRRSSNKISIPRGQVPSFVFADEELPEATLRPRKGRYRSIDDDWM